MKDRIFDTIKSEKANAMVENVIILPLIFIIIYAMLMTSFVMHDKATVEGAAKRGAIYAAHCICDPNYANILSKSNNVAGSLDVDIGENGKFSFSGLGKDIEAYRYLSGSTTNIENKVKTEVEKIIKKTSISWRDLEVDNVKFKCVNKILYQDVAVTVSADYPMPKFFRVIGLDSELEYKVTAKMAVNDPDEFIRNADLIVDLVVEIDDMTGNKMSGAFEKVGEKISGLATKLMDWIKV